MALSRSREYEADASGAHLIGDGEPLARALEKIEAYAKRIPMNMNPAQATAYIINPLTGRKVQVRQPVQHPPADGRPHRPPPPPRLLTELADGGLTPRASVAEVGELQRDAEVVLAHRLDRGLQVVASSCR